MMTRFVAAIMLLLFTSACAHQAIMLSEPAGATVYVDGDAIGVTPCNYSYKLSAGESYEVVVEKPGFETVAYTMVADEVDTKARNKWLAAGAVIPMGSALFVGALFTKRLKASYEFVLKKDKAQITAQAGASREQAGL